MQVSSVFCAYESSERLQWSTGSGLIASATRFLKDGAISKDEIAVMPLTIIDGVAAQYHSSSTQTPVKIFRPKQYCTHVKNALTRPLRTRWKARGEKSNFLSVIILQCQYSEKIMENKTIPGRLIQDLFAMGTAAPCTRDIQLRCSQCIMHPQYSEIEQSSRPMKVEDSLSLTSRNSHMI